jgi:tripartite-type tricarboxylate transporter receptor subunit TctC
LPRSLSRLHPVYADRRPHARTLQSARTKCLRDQYALHPLVPNVPTSGEAGLPEFQALVWIALFAPKETPRPILDKLTDALDQALDDQNVRKGLLDIGSDIPGKAKRGQQPLAALVKSEIARWTPIIKAAM